jgi:hypothetical protein
MVARFFEGSPITSGGSKKIKIGKPVEKLFFF